MADGKWVMTEDDAKRVDLTYGGEPRYIRELPNYGETRYVDDRSSSAKKACAFCGSDDLENGFGGYGDGFAYDSVRCVRCGGTTNFVYRDDVEKFFKEEVSK